MQETASGMAIDERAKKLRERFAPLSQSNRSVCTSPPSLSDVENLFRRQQYLTALAGGSASCRKEELRFICLRGPIAPALLVPDKLHVGFVLRLRCHRGTVNSCIRRAWRAADLMASTIETAHVRRLPVLNPQTTSEHQVPGRARSNVGVIPVQGSLHRIDLLKVAQTHASLSA